MLIEDAVSMVHSMVAEEKLKAIQYWNAVSERLQIIVNHSVEDISALAFQMEGEKLPDYIDASQLVSLGMAPAFMTRYISKDDDTTAQKRSTYKPVNGHLIVADATTNVDLLHATNIPVTLEVDGRIHETHVARVSLEEVMHMGAIETVEEVTQLTQCSTQMWHLFNIACLVSVAASRSTHSWTHSKPYTCSDCDARFSTKGNLIGKYDYDELESEEPIIVHVHSCSLFHSRLFESVGYGPELFLPNILPTAVVEYKYEDNRSDWNSSRPDTPLNALIWKDMPLRIATAVVAKMFWRNIPGPRPIDPDIHRRRHSGERPYACPSCDASFSTKGNLKRHVKSHSGEKPWECTECHSRFTEKKSLKVHMRRHTGERPYECNVCLKRFSQTSILQSHLAMHMNERAHLCNECGKSFRQKSQLRLHEQRHAGVRKYQCPHCTYKFLMKGFVEMSACHKHVKIHEREKIDLQNLTPISKNNAQKENRISPSTTESVPEMPEEDRPAGASTVVIQRVPKSAITYCNTKNLVVHQVSGQKVTTLPNNPMNFTENQHGNAVLEKLKVQREEGRFCDVTLYVEGKQFRAHRNVLASCSPYFDSVLKMHRTVKEHLTVTCQNSEIFQCLLNYMYTGTVVIDKNNVTELLRLANHFLVSKLKSYCAEYLDRYLDISNCLSVKEMAEKYNMPALLKAATLFVQSGEPDIPRDSHLNGVTEEKIEKCDTCLSIPKTRLKRRLILRRSHRRGKQKFFRARPGVRLAALKAALVARRSKGHHLRHDQENEDDSIGDLPQDGLKCHLCSHVARGTSRLEQHLALVHEKDVTYKCGICGFICQWNNDYYNHMKTHFPGPPFKCDSCKQLEKT
ncbi:hypothetical protein C0J52_01507 [Blattella germanica]|nr:hypothetical protein C0J52_01507 [Blattella germanica]